MAPARCPAGLAALLLAPDALEGRQVGLHVKDATCLRVALDGMASGSDELRAAFDRTASSWARRGFFAKKNTSFCHLIGSG